jgi:hypothetical protein
MVAAAHESSATHAPRYTDLSPPFPASEAALESIRAAADLAAQRRHLWGVFAGITRADASGALPVFLTWYGAGEVFAAQRDARSPEEPRELSRIFSRGPPHRVAEPSAAPPLMVFAHYNRPAYRHIRDDGLFLARHLGALAAATASVPAFPRDAVVIKTVWWPVPSEGNVGLPVWDPADNPARAHGNSYLTWSRVVALSAQRQGESTGRAVDVDFLGRHIVGARAVGADSFFHVVLEQTLADEVMLDPAARKLSFMLLGRPLRANDTLVLVALHVATREIADWIWGTFWWHDAPDRGRYAAQRPAALGGPWRHYLMDVAFDAEKPTETDGTPRITFNPWLEARFEDSGHGSGLVSNCMACHRRASTKTDSPFVVTRGAELPVATAPGTVSTSLLWSIPMQAR